MADRVSLTLRGAAAMATAAYTFTAEPFLRAGWQDACVQLGPAVACGLNPDADEGVRTDFRALRQALAQGKTLRRTVVSGVQQ